LAFGAVGPSQAFADPGGAPNANAGANAQGSAGSAVGATNSNASGNSANAPGQVKQNPGPTVSSQGGILLTSLTTTSSTDNTKNYPNPGATKDNPIPPTYTGGTKTGSTGDVKSGSANSHDTGQFGDVHNPQPLSTADKNSGGANGQCTGTNNGPYCSTRDGTPSLNGNGNGNAYGKPCAGCVGRADNKNPQDQKPGGNDHNAGYECDSNKGIGKTNPAHTGCTTPTSTACPPGTDHAGQNVTPCDNPPNVCPAGTDHAGQNVTPCDNPPNVCPAGTDHAGQNVTPCDDITVIPGCVVTAENPCTTPPPGCEPTVANNFCSDVLGEVNQKPTVVDGVSLPTTNEPGVQVLGEKVTRGSTLPFTGTDAIGLATTSALFLLGGSVLLWLGRRRRTQ
jgi:hypothetical protein